MAKIAIEPGRNLLFPSPFVRPASVVPADWTFAAVGGISAPQRSEQDTAQLDEVRRRPF